MVIQRSSTVFFMIAVLLYSATISMAKIQKGSPGCNGGGAEAEKIFQLARSYESGIRGMPQDDKKAIALYEESMKMGSAKAAINLGTMYRTAMFGQPKRQERLSYMNALYEYAVKLGCPDGYYFLALLHYKGWGVQENAQTGEVYLKKAAESGSLAGMTDYGNNLYDDGHQDEGKKWIVRALEGGFADAGSYLAIIYSFEKNAEKNHYLREGAKLGSSRCLLSLSTIYAQGNDGQEKDEEYAECFRQLRRQADNDEAPEPIKDFDTLCPPRKVLPFKR